MMETIQRRKKRLRVQIRGVGWFYVVCSVLLILWGVLNILAGLSGGCDLGDGQQPNLGEGLTKVAQTCLVITGLFFIIMGWICYRFGRALTSCDGSAYISRKEYILAVLFMLAFPIGTVAGIYSVVLFRKYNKCFPGKSGVRS